MLIRASRFVTSLVGLFAVLVDADRDVSDDHVVDAHAAFKLGDLLAGSLDLEQDVIALLFFLDRICQSS